MTPTKEAAMANTPTKAQTENHRSEAFEHGVHPCERKGCRNYVAYDDEPYCFEHSPDSGGYVPGYSWQNS
jgi:hypothetical protein